MTGGDPAPIENAAVVVEDGTIRWCGRERDLPAEYQPRPAEGGGSVEKEAVDREVAGPEGTDHKVIDGQGGLLTPGFIDCHTHLVWAGSRADEFSARLHGAGYEEIARRGGGILSTVSATREASEEELFELAVPRVRALIRQGVTTIEIKSGYGLSLEHELKQLRVARRLGKELKVDVTTTLLAAHALPPEYANRADDYIGLVCEEIIPAAAEEGLADAVDAFCERIAFSREQVERVFRAASDYGLPVKLHAEQLSNQRGTELVAGFGGLSADHIEYLSPEGIAAMAEAGTTGVLLPGAFYTLRETQCPPVTSMREAGVPMAVATDANPGSSPLVSLQLMLNMACTLFRLTPEEALSGVTANAARALGLKDRGTIAAGNRADLALWKVESPAELPYLFGVNRLERLWHNGQPVSLPNDDFCG